MSRYAKGSYVLIPNKEALRGLKPATLSVFVWVCAYADEDGDCYPSRKRLMTDARISERVLDRELKALCSLGLLKKKLRYTENGDKDTNLYSVMLVEGVPAKTTPPPRKKYTTGTRKNDTTVPAKTQYRTKPDELNQLKKEKSALEIAIEDFIGMRKTKKKPVTPRALRTIMDKLVKWYPDREDLQVRCLDNAIEGAWTTVYSLKDWELKELPPLDGSTGQAASAAKGWSPAEDKEDEAMRNFNQGGEHVADY